MLDKSKVREWLQETGGYQILDPQFFLDMGLPEELVKRLDHSHSDDHEQLGKHTANRKDGEPGPVEGVSEFSAVDAVAGLVGVEPCHMYYGRGKNFRETVRSILKALK